MVRAVRNLPEGVRYPRKKGYAKRYVRSEFRKNRLQLLLGIVFLLGIVTGCSIAGQSGEAAGNTVITTLGQYLASAGTYGESGEFLSRMLSSFGATTLILFFLFLCGLGAVFQPVVLLVLFLRGLGLGVMGVYAYSAGQAMWYLAVLLPEAILTSILMIAAAVLLWAGDVYRPQPSDRVLCFVPVGVLVGVSLVCNRLFGWDYCYTAGGIGTPLEAASRIMPRWAFLFVLYGGLWLVIQALFYRRFYTDETGKFEIRGKGLAWAGPWRR